ncbi:RND family transporter [Thalassotalea aquiviva]|uniref:efflux RND transporter permease subunit n=1 Tax=Thalassotalea aquiviva TaxID=3242415 RepID=UPI00352B680A
MFDLTWWQMSTQQHNLYHRIFLSKPLLSGLLLLAVCVFFMMYINQFRLDASSDTLVLENDASVKFYRQVKDRYGSDNFLIMTLSPRQPIFQPASLDTLNQLSQTLQNLNQISNVVSILNVPLVNSPRVSLAQLQQQAPTLQSPETNLALAKIELTKSPLYKNLLISEDGSTIALLLFIEENQALANLSMQRAELTRLKLQQPLTSNQTQQLKLIERQYSQAAQVAQVDNAEFIATVRSIMQNYQAFAQLHLGGLPMITSDSIEFIRSDLTSFGFIVLAFIIITLAVAFSRVKWVVLPLITCVVTGAVMIGFLGLMNWPVTIVSSNFISLMLILTLSLLIHLIVRYQEYHWQNPQADQAEIVLQTLKKKLIPCVFTTITTIVAFGSLTVSDIRPVIEFGWMMSIGVSLAFVLVFTLFPIMVMFFKPGRPVNQHNVTKQLALGFANRLLGNKNKIFVFYSVLFALSLVGINQLTVENRFIDYFKKDTEIYQGMMLIDQKLGGTTPLDVLIDAPTVKEETDTVIGEEEEEELFAELGLDDDDFTEFEQPQETELNGYWFNVHQINNIANYHQYLDGLSQTGKVMSLMSGMSLINQVEPNSKKDDFTLAILYSKLPQQVKDIILSPYISADGDQIRFSIRVFESDKALKRSELLGQIQQGLTSQFQLQPEQISFTGMLVLYNNMLQSLFDSQIKTLGIVFFCILMMFIIMYKNVLLATITLVPNVISALLVLGIMGLANVPLDIMTITIAAICIGIAVDNSIHYVHRFQLEYQQCQDYQQAMLNSHASIGRAMYYTSITITLGFSILMFSNFIPSVYFGVLTGFSMLVALLANLSLLPLLLIQFKPFKTL